MGKQKWHKDSIPNQRGKTVVVTGANSGTGFAFSKTMAEHEAHVILACRNLEKGNAALEVLKKDVPDAKLDLEYIDLSDLSTVRTFASNLITNFPKIDILCNNAGVMMAPQITTVDGFDFQLSSNHLGHFLLTGLLLGHLKKHSRVITMSSSFHFLGNIHFDDINLKRSFTPTKAYAQSKLANLLFSFELARRFELNNVPIMSIGAHPGWSKTRLQSAGLSMGKGFKNWFMKSFLRFGNFVVGQSAEKGAYPLLMAATSNSVKGGDYLGPAHIFNARGYPKHVKSSKKSKNTDLSKQLWDLSEQLTGFTYNFNEVNIKLHHD